jgi:hypothetical protein
MGYGLLVDDPMEMMTADHDDIIASDVSRRWGKIRSIVNIYDQTDMLSGE